MRRGLTAAMEATARAGAGERRYGVHATVWLAVLVAAASTVALVFSPVALEGTGGSWISDALRHGWSPFCHQDPDRSFHVAGIQLLACARCTGIFGGALLGVLAFPVVHALRHGVRAPRWLLAVALAPVALDVAAQVVGIWDGTLLARALTGAMAGSLSAVFLMPHLDEAVVDISRSVRGRLRGA